MEDALCKILAFARLCTKTNLTKCSSFTPQVYSFLSYL